MSYSFGLNQYSGSFVVGNGQLLSQNPSDSGSGRTLKKSQEQNEYLSQKNGNFYLNDGDAEIEENKLEEKKSLHNQEEKQKYIEQIKNQKINHISKSEKDKEKYVNESNGCFNQLQELHSWLKSSIIDKEVFVVQLVYIEQNSSEVLSKWGPKRCRLYLKLASLYSIAENYNMKDELLTKATDDLNEMDDIKDKHEISECRRWLYLLRIESHMNNDNNKTELTQEKILLDKCWNVKQRHFEGRRDFLDFYAIFLAKHLLRSGEYKRAERAHLDALALRSQREKFWDQDDFDWSKLEKEVKKEIEEKRK